MRSIGSRTRIAASVSVWIVLVVASSPARAEPPIRSPEDAACRTQARSKVFTAPNPLGLELEDIGRQIYFACMKISQAIAPPAKHTGRRHHRRRR